MSIVGYGNDGAQEYWIERNLWGAVWGDNGYIWIANTSINDADICVINSQPSYPLTKHA